MNFNTILFDLDDTLLDRNRSLYTFIELFKAKYDHVLVCEGDLKFKDIFLELDCSGYKPREEMFKELLNITSWRIKPKIKEIMDYWNTEFPKCALPVTDLYGILDYFQDKKINMGIVTNSFTNFQYAKIDKLNLRKYMKTIVISEEVGMSKPDPEIYYLALSRIDAKPDTTLFVGDYPSTDIKGAYDSKIASVWLSHGKTWDIEDYRPCYIINDLSELINIVGNL
jgi:putative hydrolase of the HAD superfamily